MNLISLVVSQYFPHLNLGSLSCKNECLENSKGVPWFLKLNDSNIDATRLKKYVNNGLLSFDSSIIPPILASINRECTSFFAHYDNNLLASFNFGGTINISRNFKLAVILRLHIGVPLAINLSGPSLHWKIDLVDNRHIFGVIFLLSRNNQYYILFGDLVNYRVHSSNNVLLRVETSKFRNIVLGDVLHVVDFVTELKPHYEINIIVSGKYPEMYIVLMANDQGNERPIAMPVND